MDYRRKNPRFLAVLFFALAAFSSPVAAQIGATLSVHNQERLRGEAISDSRPVAALALSHDEANGLYFGGSASIVATRRDGAQLLAVQGNAGYAPRVGQDLVLDLGVRHSAYTEYSSIADGGSYTEVYAGLTGRILSGYIFYSPRYFRDSDQSLYGELNAHVDLDPKWTVLAHAGALVWLGDHARNGYGTYVDWRLGARRSMGRFELDVAWVGRTAHQSRYYTRIDTENEVVFGLIYTL